MTSRIGEGNGLDNSEAIREPRDHVLAADACPLLVGGLSRQHAPISSRRQRRPHAPPTLLHPNGWSKQNFRLQA